MKLLQKVADTTLSDSLSLRKNRGEFYETERNNTEVNEDYRKRQNVQMRLRRGRLMHQRYYRSEKERLDEEKARIE